MVPNMEAWKQNSISDIILFYYVYENQNVNWPGLQLYTQL